MSKELRSTCIEGTAIAKLMLEGASQVAQSQFAWCRRGFGGHVKEGDW